VMAVARDLGARAGNPRFDPLLQLVWRSRHDFKPSVLRPIAILAEA
jgi:hypothetical protein